MAVSEVGMPGRIKAALPAGAAALAVVAAVAGASLMSSNAPSAPIVASDEPVITTSEAQPPPPGSSVPGVAFDQVPGGAVAQNMEIVVKFKDDKKVKEITDAFWKDQGSARAKFEAFKASHPEFANLTLDRVTYSNELVLVDASGASGAQRLSAMRAIAAKLKGSGDISYAEPNMTAQPGGQ